MSGGAGGWGPCCGLRAHGFPVHLAARCAPRGCQRSPWPACAPCPLATRAHTHLPPSSPPPSPAATPRCTCVSSTTSRRCTTSWLITARVRCTRGAVAAAGRRDARCEGRWCPMPGRPPVRWQQRSPWRAAVPPDDLPIKALLGSFDNTSTQHIQRSPPHRPLPRPAPSASVTVRNYSGLTPLVLAAQLGKMAMFQHIYNRRRRAFYTFGKVGRRARGRACHVRGSAAAVASSVVAAFRGPPRPHHSRLSNHCAACPLPTVAR